MRAYNRADGVKVIDRILEIFLECTVHSIFQGAGAPGNRNQFATQDFHLGDIGVFLFDVNLTHVNFTWDVHQCTGAGERHAMLTRPGFCQHLGLAHVLGQQCFTQAVIDFMCARVIEIFTLEENACSSNLVTQAFGVEQWAGASHVISIQVRQFFLKSGCLAYFLVGLVDVVHDGLEFRWQNLSAVFTEITIFVRHGGKLMRHDVLRVVDFCLGMIIRGVPRPIQVSRSGKCTLADTGASSKLF